MPTSTRICMLLNTKKQAHITVYCASSSQSAHKKKSSKREDYPKAWIILVSTKDTKEMNSKCRSTHHHHLYYDDERPQPEAEFPASYSARSTGREGLSGIANGSATTKSVSGFHFLVSCFLVL